MATLRHLNSEFRPHHSAAAIRGITSNADLHYSYVAPLQTAYKAFANSSLSSPIAARSPAMSLAGFKEKLMLLHFASVANG
jgi:hypothetical protein